jgi:hypothetical protein
METSGFSLGRLNHRVDALTDSVGQAVFEVGKDFTFVAFERFRQRSYHGKNPGVPRRWLSREANDIARIKNSTFPLT